MQKFPYWKEGKKNKTKIVFDGVLYVERIYKRESSVLNYIKKNRTNVLFFSSVAGAGFEPTTFGL